MSRDNCACARTIASLLIVLLMAWSVGAFGQTGVVQLACSQYSGNAGYSPDSRELITINYDARSMTIQQIDPAGNAIESITGASGNPVAEFFEDRIVATYRSGKTIYTFNRYSAVLSLRNYWDYNNIWVSAYSSPCQPYQRGQRQY